MSFVSRRADLLERGIQGHPSPDPEVGGLVGTVRRIPALTSPACAPADEFVSALGLRLRAEALTLPAREVVPASGRSQRLAKSQGRVKSGRRASGASGSGTRPKVFVIGRGLPRALAGVTASLLLVGAVVGGTSRFALPGGLLYPVKQVLDSAAVQLAGSDFDRGVTLLSQAQEHISDVGALVRRDGARTDPMSVDKALASAYDAVSVGQRALLGEFDRAGNTQALIAVQDFAVRALPQLSALRPLVPAASRPDVDALITLLQQTRTTLVPRIAACGRPCASLVVVRPASSPDSAPSTGLPKARTTGSLPVPGLPTPGGLSVPGPTAPITGPAGVVVGPTTSPLRVASGTRGAVLPPVTVVPTTVPPSLIVIPTPSLPLPPIGLPGLP
jgi:hypothetical protein